MPAPALTPEQREAHVDRMWSGRRQRVQTDRDPKEHIATLEAENAALRQRIAQLERERRARLALSMNGTQLVRRPT